MVITGRTRNALALLGLVGSNPTVSAIIVTSYVSLVAIFCIQENDGQCCHSSVSKVYKRNSARVRVRQIKRA